MTPPPPPRLNRVVYVVVGAAALAMIGVAYLIREGPRPAVVTPESYLGLGRAESFVNPLRPGTRAYHAPARLPLNGLAYGGRWTLSIQGATAAGDSSLSLRFGARRVFLVLGSPEFQRR